jgi:hypothetical protein
VRVKILSSTSNQSQNIDQFRVRFVSRGASPLALLGAKHVKGENETTQTALINEILPPGSLSDYLQ